MTDETFAIIEAEILLSIAAILKRHGVEHFTPHTHAGVHGVPVSQMPPLSARFTRERGNETDAPRDYLQASIGMFGLALYSEDIR